MAILELADLRKSFDRRPALRSINLSVEQGEILALLGPTGAGKTSTLLSVAGLLLPDAGRITIGGRDMTRVDPRLRDIAMVFESFNLLPVLSTYENIAFPLRSPIYGESRDEVDLRVRRAAADLKIGHLLERKIDQLSGGERQRVAIARALVRNPTLYLLDEPLSALDLKLRESLRLEMRDLQQKHCATILYATHDYHGAAAIADRIALIEDGTILQVDTLAELIRDPRTMSVGRLIGSPSMAVFKAHIADGKLVVPDYAEGFDLEELGIEDPPGPDPHLGFWPEDIVLRATPGPGLQRGEVYATDFRGMDRALQVRFGRQSFRKVVPLEVPFGEGAECWFRLPAASAFVFEGATGVRTNRARQARPR